ncbi:MAG: hypothetical protein ABR990_05480 [Terracidiphilus sp.]|jgi:hypothetical protein
MRRITTLFILVFAFSVLLHGQTDEREGKSWLDTNTAPPQMNVTGIWDGGDWGMVSLNQHQGGRRIIGTADSWDVTGIVSGKTVYLLIWKKDKVAFSARLTIEGSSQLTGVYAKGILSSTSKMIPIQLKK